MPLKTVLGIIAFLIILGIIIYQIYKGEEYKDQEHPKNPDDIIPPSPFDSQFNKRELLAREREISQYNANIKLDPLIDEITELKLESKTIKGTNININLPNIKKIETKPFALEALNSKTNQWETPQDRSDYIKIRAGIQLSNRKGQISELEYAEFKTKIKNFAEKINAQTNLADSQPVLHRAKELEKFAKYYDQQLILIIRPRKNPWTASLIEEKASEIGFQKTNQAGQMQIKEKQNLESGLSAAISNSNKSINKNTICELSYQIDQETKKTERIKITLDIPQVALEQNPFQTFKEATFKLSGLLDGIIIDTEEKAIHLAKIDDIEEKILKNIYEGLEKNQIPAGSILAKRLFN